jgi:hypothetical protein
MLRIDVDQPKLLIAEARPTNFAKLREFFTQIKSPDSRRGQGRGYWLERLYEE